MDYVLINNKSPVEQNVLVLIDERSNDQAEWNPCLNADRTVNWKYNLIKVNEVYFIYMHVFNNINLLIYLFIYLFIYYALKFAMRRYRKKRILQEELLRTHASNNHISKQTIAFLAKLFWHTLANGNRQRTDV